MLKIKKLKPMFNGVLCTANKYTEPQFIAGSNIIDPSKTKQGLKEYQTVLAVGEFVKSVKEGDTICVNPKNYEVRKFDRNTTKESMNEVYNEVTRYAFNVIIVDAKECLLIQDRDIDFVIEVSEEVSDPTPSTEVIKPKSKIILP